jgi:lysophospholipase L1-like esterase
MAFPFFRKLAARLVLLAVSVGVSVLVAELAVRLARPQAVMLVSQGLYIPDDPPGRYRLQPGFRGTVTNRVEFDTEVSINQAGMRGPEIGPASPGGVRILALGDSFIFGIGAEQGEAFPARLEEILRKSGVPAQVLNAGAPGFSVPEEVAWFERWGRSLDPDVVVIAVFTGNDLQDAAPEGAKVTAVDGHLAVEGEEGRPMARWLYSHSHLYVLLKTSALGGAIRRLLGLPEPFDERLIRTEMSFYEKGAPLPDLAASGAAATERAVAELAAGAGKARVMAVVIPTLLQVSPAAWNATLERLQLDPAKHDPDRTTRLFQEIFERHGIPFLDLTRPFVEAVGRGERIYYPIDQHLTPLGYELMAREVGGFVFPPNVETPRGASPDREGRSGLAGAPAARP